MPENKKKETQLGQVRFDNRLRFIAIATVVGVLFSALIMYSVLQRNSEQAIRSAILDQREQLQIQYTNSVSQDMASDLKSLMDKLETLSLSNQVQDGDITGAAVQSMLARMYTEATKISPVEDLYLLNQNNIVTSYFDPHQNSTNGGYVGYDASKSPPVVEFIKNLPNPTFSDAYKSEPTGSEQISLLYPIYSSSSGKYLGATVMALDLRTFLSKYGNLDDITSQYIVILDRNATFMTSPLKSIIGENFFSNSASRGTTQAATDHYRKVLSGQAHAEVFGYRNLGDRLNTGTPVFIEGKPVYFVFVVTPITSIYALIGSILSTQESEMYFLLAGISAVVVLSSFLILRLNAILEKAVSERTLALREAIRKLSLQEKLQKEFINVAAHELRTPITPILVGLTTQIHQSRKAVSIHREEYDMVVRNAKRLKRLSEDILDVARIEADNLKLTLEQVSLDQVICDAINVVKTDSREGVENIEYDRNGIILMADRERLGEVVSNLLSNAVKFTERGSIRIRATRHESKGDVEVEVVDCGSGIDPEIIPKLFTKFATKSYQGTGLGLFICKSIVEAHGGRIWGKNNESGVGASFGFTIPASWKTTSATSAN